MRQWTTCRVSQVLTSHMVVDHGWMFSPWGRDGVWIISPIVQIGQLIDPMCVLQPWHIGCGSIEKSTSPSIYDAYWAKTLPLPSEMPIGHCRPHSGLYVLPDSGDKKLIYTWSVTSSKYTYVWWIEWSKSFGMFWTSKAICSYSAKRINYVHIFYSRIVKFQCK